MTQPPSTPDTRKRSTNVLKKRLSSIRVSGTVKVPSVLSETDGDKDAGIKTPPVSPIKNSGGAPEKTVAAKAVTKSAEDKATEAALEKILSMPTEYPNVWQTAEALGDVKTAGSPEPKTATKGGSPSKTVTRSLSKEKMQPPSPPKLIAGAKERQLPFSWTASVIDLKDKKSPAAKVIRRVRQDVDITRIKNHTHKI